MSDLIQFPGLAAYVDIMGQRCEFDKLMKTKWWEPNTDTTAAWSKTWGRVILFRKDVGNFFQGYGSQANKSIWQTIVGPDTDQSLGEPKETRIKTRFIGDAALLTMSLDIRNDLIPLNDIYGVIASCVSLLIFSLARGYSVRGGVEIGPCLHDPETDEDYGVAIGTAVDLEKQANYHRILIGGRLVSYLHNLPYSTGNLLKDSKLAVVPTILSVFKEDTDARIFIDFLGDNSTTTPLRRVPNGTHILEKAVEFVAAQLNDTNLSKDIRQKYELLRDYFLTKDSTWGGLFSRKLKI